MIAGTFIVEDHSIHFWTLSNGLVMYTVQVTRNGATSATKSVGLAEFSAAVHMALLGEEDASECLYEWALIAMPKVKDIHDRSEMSPEEAEAAVRNLRWIP